MTYELPEYILTYPLVGRLNRPGLMVYGGSIRAGSCEGMPQLDIVSAFQSYGQYLQDGKTDKAETVRYNTNRHACPGPGACGGVSLGFSRTGGSHDELSKYRCTPRTRWLVQQKPWV